MTGFYIRDVIDIRNPVWTGLPFGMAGGLLVGLRRGIPDPGTSMQAYLLPLTQYDAAVIIGMFVGGILAFAWGYRNGVYRSDLRANHERES